MNRRMLHRPWLVYYMPQLLVIDGIPISEEERGKSELYFLEQQVSLTAVVINCITVIKKMFLLFLSQSTILFDYIFNTLPTTQLKFVKTTVDTSIMQCVS